MLNVVNEIDVIQTTMLRALASVHRLRIVHVLGEGPLEVNELARELDLGQATVSQHLAALRNVGLVEATRDGRSVRYQLADPQILDACGLMRDVIVRRLSALGSLAAAADPGADPSRGGAGRPRTPHEPGDPPMSDDSLSLVLFSGTADKLHAAATLAAGASAMGRPVNVLLQYWALDAFRADRIEGDHGLAFDAMAPGSQQAGQGHRRRSRGSRPSAWRRSSARSASRPAPGSLETLGVDAAGLDPLVDGPCGIASFLLAAEDGQILFI